MEEVTGCTARDLRGGTELRCTRKDGRCGYHRPDESFTPANLLPKGLCPSAYHALYPHSLAILFEGSPDRVPMAAYCPGTTPCVVFRRVFEPIGMRHRLLKMLKMLVRPVMRAQLYTASLGWEVADVLGDCPAGHAVGQRFMVDKGGLHVTRRCVLPMGDASTACPALFHNLFTYLPLARVGKGPARRPGRQPRFVCPDHLANITLEVGRDD